MGDAILREAEQSFEVARPTRKAHLFDEECKRVSRRGRKAPSTVAQWRRRSRGGTDESCQERDEEADKKKEENSNGM